MLVEHPEIVMRPRILASLLFATSIVAPYGHAQMYVEEFSRTKNTAFPIGAGTTAPDWLIIGSGPGNMDYYFLKTGENKSKNVKSFWVRIYNYRELTMTQSLWTIDMKAKAGKIQNSCEYNLKTGMLTGAKIKELDSFTPVAPGTIPDEFIDLIFALGY